MHSAGTIARGGRYRLAVRGYGSQRWPKIQSMHRDGVRLGMAVVIVLGMLGVLFVALAGASNAALLSALLWQ